MSKGLKIALIIAISVGVIGSILLCSAMFRSKAAPAPAVTSTPVVQETRDCDDEDRANREWEDCGIGVLLDPGKKSTAPAVKPSTKAPVPVQTKCTRTPTRRC